MPTSNEEIVNGALSLLGIAPIVTIGEDSVAGGLAQRDFARIRDELLASHPWGFATKRVALVDLSPAPDEGTGYQRRLQLPPDYLRIVEVIDQLDQAWSVEDRELWTNIEGDIFVRYIAQVVAPGKFSLPFIEALEHRLASRWAEPLSRSSELKQAVRGDAEYALRGSRSSDGQEASIRVVDMPGGWVNER